MLSILPPAQVNKHHTMSLLIAYDSSGSTCGHPMYHQQTQKIIAELGARMERAIIFQWCDQGKLISWSDLNILNTKMRGGGGTDPVCVANYICDTNFTGDMVLITDGEVSASNIDRTDSLLCRRSFRSVAVHLIETGGVVNMSVSCPFTRNSPHTIVRYAADPAQEDNSGPLVYNPSLTSWEAFARPREAHAIAQIVTRLSDEDIAALDNIRRVNTVSEYLAAADMIERTVVARTMGKTGDPTLRDTILAMKKRILVEDASIYGESETATHLYDALGRRDTAQALVFASDMTREYYGDDAADGKSWSARINRLISMCEGALRGVFDLSGIHNAIRTDRARRAATLYAVDVNDVPITQTVDDDVTAESFTCPITMDEEHDVVVLMANDCKSVLAGIDKTIVDAVIDCPLNALNYPIVIDRLKAKIDHPISLRAYKDARDFGTPIVTSPFTRRAVNGGLCLGASKEHCAATSWSLAHVIGGGKKLGNLDLWFAVVWLLVERGTFPYLTTLLPSFRAHMRYRLQNRMTYLSLTGLPELPTSYVKLSVAVWYVFASGALGLSARRQAIRAHLFHTDALAGLVRLAGYDLPAGTEAYAARLRGVARALASVKKPNGRNAFHNRVMALTQACVRVDVESSAVRDAVRLRETQCDAWIPVDGPASETQIAAVMAEFASRGFDGLCADDLRLIAQLVHPSKSMGDIDVPFETLAAVPPTSPPLIEWAYGSHVPAHVTICPATCRPYYNPQPSVTWREACQTTFGIAAEQTISLNEQYGVFVLRYKMYPTRDEFLLFLYNRYVVHGTQHHTLPAHIDQYVSEVFAEYAPIVSSLPAEMFVRRWLASRSIETRVEREKNDDDYTRTQESHNSNVRPESQN